MRWLLARFQASRLPGLQDLMSEWSRYMLTCPSLLILPRPSAACIFTTCRVVIIEMHQCCVCFLFFVCFPSLCVFQIQEASPALKAGLEPFFDFILSIGNTRLVSAPTLCFEMLLLTLQVLAINEGYNSFADYVENTVDSSTAPFLKTKPKKTPTVYLCRDILHKTSDILGCFLYLLVQRDICLSSMSLSCASRIKRATC